MTLGVIRKRWQGTKKTDETRPAAFPAQGVGKLEVSHRKGRRGPGRSRQASLEREAAAGGEAGSQTTQPLHRAGSQGGRHSVGCSALLCSGVSSNQEPCRAVARQLSGSGRAVAVGMTSLPVRWRWRHASPLGAAGSSFSLGPRPRK